MTTSRTYTRERSAAFMALERAESLHHSIELRPHEARYLFTQMHNDWQNRINYAHPISPWQMYQLVRAIDKAAPRCNFGMLNGTPNPNNGHAFHEYTIGKAYSRLILVTFYKKYNERADYTKLAETVKIYADHYQAEEIDVIENTDTCMKIRMWWD